MTMTRNDMVRQLEPGLMGVLGLNYAAVPDEHTSLYEIKNSDRAFEEETNMVGMGLAFAKPEGTPIQYDSMEESWTARYQHETIALGFSITEEAVEDNLYEDYSSRATQELGRALAETKQIKAAAPFNNAFNANYVGGDGQPLISATHPTKSGNQSNLLAGDISEATLEAAVIQIGQMLNERGIMINSVPMSLHIPLQSEFIVKRLLGSDLSTTLAMNGSNGITNVNDINALKNMGYFKQIYVHRRFTDPDAWFIKTDAKDGTKMFIRKALVSKMEGDFETGNMRYKARERYCFGWSDWRQWFGSPGA